MVKHFLQLCCQKRNKLQHLNCSRPLPLFPERNAHKDKSGDKCSYLIAQDLFRPHERNKCGFVFFHLSETLQLDIFVLVMVELVFHYFFFVSALSSCNKRFEAFLEHRHHLSRSNFFLPNSQQKVLAK